MIDMEPRISQIESTLAQTAHLQLKNEITLDRLERDIGRMAGKLEAHADSMRALEGKLERYIDESKQEVRNINKAWGELANKLGTIVEDIVAPNIRRMATDEFGLAAIEDFSVRAWRNSRRGPSRQTEYDVICAGPGKVIVVEVKSTPRLEWFLEFPPHLAEFFDFYPEYERRELIGVFASWSLPPQLLPVISKAGLYGIAMGEGTMEIVARPAREIS